MFQFAVERDAVTAAFFDGTSRGEFLLVQDTQNGEFLSPQFDTATDPERYTRVPAAGTGTVVSWSVVHQRGTDGTVTRVPVGIVEFDEGPWWYTQIDGADPDDDLMGRRVRVAFETAGGGEAVPYFTVTGTEDVR